MRNEVTIFYVGLPRCKNSFLASSNTTVRKADGENYLVRNFKIYAVGVTVIISGKLFNANVRDRSLDLGVDGRITLRWIQSKTGYTHLRI